MIIDTKVSHNRKPQIKKENSNKKKITLLICLSLISIIIIFIYAIYNLNNKNYNSIKENRNKPLIYSQFSENNKDIPYVNINSENIKLVNQNIIDFCNIFFEYENTKIFYEYDLNGNYLSLAIKVKTNGLNELKPIYFKTYNINLKTKTYIDDDNLKNYFKINDDFIYQKVYNQFKNYYQEEIEEGYIDPNECNFECYINYRDFNDFNEDISLYIKNGNLFALKPFKAESLFGEEEYFSDESFEIALT